MKSIKGYDTSIGGHWVTIAGRRVFIRDGQTKSEAMIEGGYFKKNEYNENNVQYIKDDNGKHYLLHNGQKIEFLKPKEYKEKSDKLYNDLKQSERNALVNYVDTPFAGGSGDLNSLNKYNIDKTYTYNEVDGYDRIKNRPYTLFVINNDKDNVMTRYEYDKKRIEFFDKHKEELKGYDASEIARRNGFAPADLWEDSIEKARIRVNKYKDDKFRNDYINKIEKLNDVVNEDRKKLREFSDNYDYKNEYFWKDENYIKLKEEGIKKIKEKEKELNLENKVSYEYLDIEDYNYLIKKDKLYIKGELEDRKYTNIKKIIDKVKKGDIETEPANRVEEIKNVISEQNELDKIFKEKGITFDKDIIVFRRARESEEEIKEGFTKLGYISTTYKNSIAKKMPSGLEFGDKELEIIIPKGTKVLPLRSVVEARITPDETGKEGHLGVAKQNEILLPRESYYKFVKYDWETNRWVVVLERK